MRNWFIFPRIKNYFKGSPDVPAQRDVRQLAIREERIRGAMETALPRDTTDRFRDLIVTLAHTDIEFPHLKGVVAAQWAIESAYGRSSLARRGRNYAGMKWRKGDAKYGGVQGRRTQDQYERGFSYSYFDSPEGFIRAYWARLDEVSAYRGWRAHAHDPRAFIEYVGPIWVGYEPQKYVRNVWHTYVNRFKRLGL